MENDIALTDRVERLKMARNIKQKEADHRRDKRWRIFSWASSLLLGSIAGTVAITANQTDSLPPSYKAFLIFAVVILAAYSILWTIYNGMALNNIWDQVKDIDEQLGVYKDLRVDVKSPNKWLKIISYGATIGLLAATTILIIILS